MQKTLGTRVAQSVRNSSKSSQAWKSPADKTLEISALNRWENCTLHSQDEEWIRVRRRDGVICACPKTPGNVKFFRDKGFVIF